MLASNLTIADHANTAGSFVLIEQEQTKTRRLLSTSTLAAPADMVISHSTSVKDGITSDRHLVSFASAEILADGSKASTVLNLSISVPRVGTPAPNKLVGRLINFLLGVDAARAVDTGSGNLDNILIGES